jgi:cytosine deaminase
MINIDSNELSLLAFNLKASGKKNKLNVLVSAGRNNRKEKLLPSIKVLLDIGVNLYATPGTSIFLHKNSIENTQMNKISDGSEPNIHSFLLDDKFDFVINILTGVSDYDEASDSKLIRKLCIENGIPLYTDLDVANLAVAEVKRLHDSGGYTYRLSDPNEPWNLSTEFRRLVNQNGGYACYHAHFDKAYLISHENLKLSQVDMQKKWKLYRYLKENYTYDDLYERMARVVETMIAQGVKFCRSFIDADQLTQLLPLQVALDVRKAYAGRVDLEFAVQPLEGVLDADSRKYFVQACELADVVGALPSRDRPTPERHLDFVFNLAKDLQKPIDAHVDQENNPAESETELLALKAIEHGLEGNVRAVHAISIAAKDSREQDRILKVSKDAGLSFIVCPSAAISMKQLDMVAPLHNSIAPLVKMLEYELPVYLGIDNISDLFMPLVDGDMWFESRLLMEACRFYDLETVAKIACDKSGMDIVTT